SPRDPALHRELGLLLMDAGRPGEAVARFRTALEMDEESSEAWLGLIRALRSAGHDEAAARALLLAPPEVRTLIGSADTPPLPALP
nr:tetratricopeptide repeat protein [Gemmatimonadota bacterium]